MDHTTSPRRTLFSHTIYSAHLRDERTIKIYRPDVPDDALPLPILYCQDGIEFFMYGRIATIAKALASQQQIPPIVIAGIEKSSRFRNEEYMPNGVRNGDYLRFFYEEAIPFIEENYSGHHEQGFVQERYLAGVSLGATVSMQMALLSPEKFSRLLLFSGAFYRELAPLLDQVERLFPLSVYLTVGEQETEVDTPLGASNFLADNLWMKSQLEKKEALGSFQMKEGKHTWGFWQKEVPEALQWLTSQSKAR